MKNILIVEDDIAMAMTLEEFVSSSGYQTSTVHSGNEALEAIKSQKPDGLLLDLNLPDIHGFDILKHLQKQQQSCAVIVITGDASMAVAVEAMQLGAHDFVPKPATQERVIVSLQNALENVELKKIVTSLEKISRDQFQSFVGKSPKMQAVYTVLENAAHSKASVFITGESGTGKELAARAVHNLSNRSDQPMEVLNCAAIPHNLLESEIFGHTKGAFTGATATREGAADRADGGTLFLDELGEMPMELQAKMLRFIQSGTFTPVGGGQEKQVDIRFISATNRDPIEAIQKGLLREDLYYRLNVIPVHLPALRERDDDILSLARHFLEKVSREEGKSFKKLSKEVQNIFLNQRWAGNVRELENTIRRIVVLNDGEAVEADMVNALHLGMNKSTLPSSQSEQTPSENVPFLPIHAADVRPLKNYEKDIITAALTACKGNITDTSRRLEINPATIYRKQKQWDEDVIE